MERVRNLSYTIKLNGKELAEKLNIDTAIEKVEKVDIKVVQGVIEVKIDCTVKEDGT